MISIVLLIHMLTLTLFSLEGVLFSLISRLAFCRSGKSNDEIVLEMVSDIQKFLPTSIGPVNEQTSTTTPTDPMVDPSTTPSSAIHSVLNQEVFRFTRLLNVIHASLHSLSQAIHGLVLLSVDIEETYKSLLLNQVPSQWQVGISVWKFMI